VARTIHCRVISRGTAKGESLVSREAISFFGGVDPNTGTVIDKNHQLFNKSVAGKILIFTTGKGSTVGSYVLYQLAKNGAAPIGIICREAEPIVAVGAIMAGIPMVDQPDTFEFKDGQTVAIDGYNGLILIED
jgi:predicted aconitase with swiveling domain